MKLRKGDKIVVIAGKYKGQTDVIKEILVDKDRIILENIIKLKKHIKPSNTYPDGGVITIDGSIHISNIQYVDSKSAKKNIPTKIGYRFEKGKKMRVSKKTKKVVN